MDLEKCRNCKEFKCIIAKAMFDAAIENRLLDMKRAKVQELIDSYRKQAKWFEDNYEKIFSETQINTLGIIYKKEHELAMEYMNI